MKKNSTLFLILLNCISLCTYAQVNLFQDFKITTGTPYPVVNAEDKTYFSDGKSTTLSIKTDGERVTILRFDFLTMKEISRKAYDFPEYTKVQKIIQLRDRLFYIYHVYDKKLERQLLYAREVNYNDGTFKETKTLIDPSTKVTVSSLIEGTGTNSYDMAGLLYETVASYDSTKILIRYRTKSKVKVDSKSFDVLGFYVFDANLDKLWGGEVEMPHTEKQMNNLAYTVGKDGTAYMLAYITDSKGLELITIKSDLSVKAKKITIDASFVFQEFKLRESVDETLVAIAYYATAPDVSKKKGLVQIKMNKEGEVLDNLQIEFPLDFINLYEKKPAKEKEKAGIPSLDIVNVTLNKDGSTMVIGEQRYFNLGPNNVTIYVYADIVATKYDKKGNVLWQVKFPKRQEGRYGMGGLSVRVIKGKNFDYILYLDNIKNLNLPLDQEPSLHKDGKGGYLTACQINDATGKVERHPLLNVDDINGTEAYQFKTSRIFNAAPNTYLLEIYIRDKQDTMVKFELQD